MICPNCHWDLEEMDDLICEFGECPNCELPIRWFQLAKNVNEARASNDALREELANKIADIEGAHVVLNDADISRSSVSGDDLKQIGLSARISMLYGELAAVKAELEKAKQYIIEHLPRIQQP